MEVIKTNKGRNKLCIENHMYVRKKVSQTNITWECVKRKSHRCRGQVKTLLDVRTFLFTYVHVMFFAYLHFRTSPLTHQVKSRVCVCVTVFLCLFCGDDVCVTVRDCALIGECVRAWYYCS